MTELNVEEKAKEEAVQERIDRETVLEDVEAQRKLSDNMETLVAVEILNGVTSMAVQSRMPGDALARAMGAAFESLLKMGAKQLPEGALSAIRARALELSASVDDVIAAGERLVAEEPAAADEDPGATVLRGAPPPPRAHAEAGPILPKAPGRIALTGRAVVTHAVGRAVDEFVMPGGHEVDKRDSVAFAASALEVTKAIARSKMYSESEIDRFEGNARAATRIAIDRSNLRPDSAIDLQTIWDSRGPATTMETGPRKPQVDHGRIVLPNNIRGRPPRPKR